MKNNVPKVMFKKGQLVKVVKVASGGEWELATAVLIGTIENEIPGDDTFIVNLMMSDGGTEQYEYISNIWWCCEEHARWAAGVQRADGVGYTWCGGDAGADSGKYISLESLATSPSDTNI